MLGFSWVWCPVAVRAQEAVRLQLSGVPGEWLQYSHRKDLVLDLPADLGGPTTARTTIRLRQLVDAVSDTSIRYVTTLEEVTFDVHPEPAQIPDLSGLQGLQFYQTTRRAGRITGVRRSEETEDAAAGLREQVESWLSQLGFPPLPEQEVEVGEDWTETVPIPASVLGLAVDYDLEQIRTVRLNEVRTAGNSAVAFLLVETLWKPPPDRSGAGGGVVSVRGSAEQMVRFDVTRGRFLGSTGTSSLELVLTPPGGNQYVAVSAAGRQITGLTASSVAGPGVTE